MKHWASIFFSILFFQHSLLAVESSEYVDQSQHTAFHVFSNGYSSLISHCNTDWPENSGQCYFNFRDNNNQSHNIRTLYTDLEDIHENLLLELKKLQAQWIEDHPVTLINQYIFIFRQSDIDTLNLLIEMLEEETLSYRVLMKKESRKSTQFFSQELYDKVTNIYLSALEPYENRF